MKLVDVERLRQIAEVEFADIIVEAYVPGLNELRLILVEGSFVDVWFSLKLLGRYSYHWLMGAIGLRLSRHCFCDNSPR